MKSAPIDPSPVLYLQNLQMSITADKLREAFGGFGELHDVRVIYEDDTVTPKGYFSLLLYIHNAILFADLVHLV